MMMATKVFALLALVAGAAAYDMGEDVTLCWATPSGGTAAREDCDGSKVEYTWSMPDPFYGRTDYNVTFRGTVAEKGSATAHGGLTVDGPTEVTDGSEKYAFDFVHSNIHSCVRSVGFCTPFISNTPGLATHAPADKGLIEDTAEYPKAKRSREFKNDFFLDVGGYTMIAHVRWFDTTGTKHDMARAYFANLVEPPKPPPVWKQCEPGEIFVAQDEGYCEPCPPGTYEKENQICLPCEFEYYNDLPKQVECKKCPDHSQIMIPSGQEAVPFLLKTGGTQLSQCACTEGYFIPQEADEMYCKECPTGAECQGNGVDLHIKPVPIIGYYARPAEPEVMFECVTEDACPGGGIGICGSGFDKDICSACADDYFMRNGKCRKCSDGNKAAAVIAIFAFILCCLFIHYAANLDRSGSLMRSTVAASAEVQSTIFFLQLFNLSLSIAISWPSAIERLMLSFSWINIDISVLSLECAYPVDFMESWRLKIAFPFFGTAFFTGFFFVHAAYLKFAKNAGMGDIKMALYKCVNANWMWTNLLYISTASTVFQAYACHKQPNGDKTFPVYPAVECSSDDYDRGIAPMATVGLILVAIGYPLAMAVIFSYGYDNMTDAVYYSTRIIRTPYKTRYYFWEAIDLVRKMAIAIVLNLGNTLSPGAQVAGCAIVVLIALVAQLHFRPFKHLAVNALTGYVLSTLLFVLILAGMILNEEEGGDIDDDMETAVVALVYASFLSCLVIAVGNIMYSYAAFIYSKRTGIIIAHQVHLTETLIHNTSTILKTVPPSDVIEYIKDVLEDEDIQTELNNSVCWLFTICAMRNYKALMSKQSKDKSGPIPGQAVLSKLIHAIDKLGVKKRCLNATGYAEEICNTGVFDDFETVHAVNSGTKGTAKMLTSTSLRAPGGAFTQ